MPLGSGLGSSAASAVAAVVAANELLGRPFERQDLLPFAMEAERVACGAGHADNVAPALLGGFLLIRSYQPLDIVRIDTPDELVCTLVHPQIEIRTEDARRILKTRITMHDAVVQWGNTAGLIAGLLKRDYAADRTLPDRRDRRARPRDSDPVLPPGEGGGARCGRARVQHLGLRPVPVRVVARPGHGDLGRRRHGRGVPVGRNRVRGVRLGNQPAGGDRRRVVAGSPVVRRCSKRQGT